MMMSLSFLLVITKLKLCRSGNNSAMKVGFGHRWEEDHLIWPPVEIGGHSWVPREGPGLFLPITAHRTSAKQPQGYSQVTRQDPKGRL